jgi:sialic acid synthase SpsE
MFQENFMIGNKAIGDKSPPYIIAEAGSNFNKNLDTAIRLIDVAAESGADAVKFQLFQADVLYPSGGELYEIFKSIELDADWIPVLNKHAKEKGIHFLASAFDRESVDVLESIDICAHKIASSETTNLAFLQYVAAKGRPMIVSTGMCDMVDVEEAANILASASNNQVAFLQCGAMYPLPAEQVNLKVINSFINRFNCPVGFSDHTLDAVASITAIGLGGSIFEKHFTLSRESIGPDHFYALEPNELKQYVNSLHQAHKSLGASNKNLLPQEREMGRREGLYAARDIHCGECINPEDIIIKRPAIGLRSRYAPVIVGAKIKTFIAKDQPITWDHVNL